MSKSVWKDFFVVATASGSLLLGTGEGAAVTIDGMDVPDGKPAVPGPGTPIAGLCSGPGAGTTFINFDDALQPCVFKDTAALRNEYLGQGVAFSHNIEFYGGTVLDECSDFAVTGYSPPNFFAVNCAVTYPDGGRAQLPAILTFTEVVSQVSVLAASTTGAGFPLGMAGFNDENEVVDTDEVM